MTHDEAMHQVRRMGVAVQKVRSNMAESDIADVSARLVPWFYGDRCVLTAIDIILQRGAVEPGELYNLMWIANLPENYALLYVWFTMHDEPALPEPDLAWHGGWE